MTAAAKKPTETEIAAYMAAHKSSYLAALMALDPEKRASIMAAYDATSRRIFADVMVDGGNSI